MKICPDCPSPSACMSAGKCMKGKQDPAYKAMGGNVAGYYNKGGPVMGCAPSSNNPSKKNKIN